MAAVLEVKYFNSFWLKKLDSITSVRNTTGIVESAVSDETNITLEESNQFIGVGQQVTGLGVSTNPAPVVVSVTGVDIVLDIPQTLDLGTELAFGPITNFEYIPAAYETTEPEGTDWYVEEARIRGGYNNTIVDLGVKAYIVEDPLGQQHRSNSIIYSGIYNSRTGINNTNQFSTGQDITKSVDPANGSIQKLYAENTNLIVFQESKVSQALIDKNAVYSADGQPMTTSGAFVIGQIQAYAGNYGISTNPESFAVYGYRKYFTDRNQNAVLRLSQDGITEISAYGMLDYFRDNLTAVSTTGRVVGMWDMHNKQYVLSMQRLGSGAGNEQRSNPSAELTVAFDEDINGWTSRFSFRPGLGGSLRNNFYTFKSGAIWEHYSTNVNKGTFYNVTTNSSVTLVFNSSVSEVKNFNTINYEGSQGWELESLLTDTDMAVPVQPFSQVYNLANIENQLFSNNFKRKENKYFATIMNNSIAGSGDIVWGQSMTGLKGFYAIGTMTINNSLYGSPTARTELFAVSTEYVNSSY
jgi:hypothetical protein